MCLEVNKTNQFRYACLGSILGTDWGANLSKSNLDDFFFRICPELLPVEIFHVYLTGSQLQKRSLHAGGITLLPQGCLDICVTLPCFVPSAASSEWWLLLSRRFTFKATVETIFIILISIFIPLLGCKLTVMFLCYSHFPKLSAAKKPPTSKREREVKKTDGNNKRE